jgi:hypothetical protein
VTTSPQGHHIQLFSLDARSGVRWRLLSGNNRDLGQSLDGFSDPEVARVGVKEAQMTLAELQPRIRRVAGNRWRWELEQDGRPIVSGSHTFDRSIRCEQALEQFTRHFADAPIGAVVMISGTRRWRRAG